jgi:hypothetical protein
VHGIDSQFDSNEVQENHAYPRLASKEEGLGEFQQDLLLGDHSGSLEEEPKRNLRSGYASDGGQKIEASYPESGSDVD